MAKLSSIEKTKAWLEHWVIALNLCPFAGRPFQNDKIRYLLIEGREVFDLMDRFVEELHFLRENGEKDTSLLILEGLGSDFEEYLDIYYFLESKLSDFGFEKDFQLASFHPDYRFEGEGEEANSHYTNRSPLALIHILRAEQVEAARQFYPDIESIPDRNIEKMDAMHPEELKIKFNEFKG